DTLLELLELVAELLVSRETFEESWLLTTTLDDVSFVELLLELLTSSAFAIFPPNINSNIIATNDIKDIICILLCLNISIFPFIQFLLNFPRFFYSYILE